MRTPPSPGGLRALLAVKARILLNAARSIRAEPPLKVAVVGGFVALWTAGSYALAREGLGFVAGFPGIGSYLLSRLLFLFALGILAMLAVSCALLAYPLLYAARENRMLLSTPLRRSAIAACKVWETLFLGAWAFVLMGCPVLVAYFQESGMGVRGYARSWLFFAPLVAFAGAAGFLAALLLGRAIPAGGIRAGRRAALVLLAASAALLFLRRGGDAPGRDRPIDFVNRVMDKCRIAAWYPLPSSWAAEGIIASARGDAGGAWILWGALASGAFFLLALCPAAGERILPAGWDRRSAGGRRALPPAARGTPARSWTAGRSAAGALAVKDALTFCRDFGQWGQFALFFGLLALYILNLRAMPYDLDSDFWRYLLFILNLSALGLTLSGLGSRFFFPLVGVDLARFWFLGVSPLGPGGILREKFLLCAAFTLGITLTLGLLSGLMLGVGPLLLASSLAAVACMGIAVSGLSVGLGALYPNLKAGSPAEAVSGLGGTMVLIANLGYILCALALQGLPLFLRLRGLLPGGRFHACVCGCSALLAAVSVSVAVFTLGAAKRGLARAEL